MKYFISIFIEHFSSDIFHEEWFGKHRSKEGTKTKTEMHSIHIWRRVVAIPNTEKKNICGRLEGAIKETKYN